MCPRSSGALISHDKLLLQVNPERELGNTSYNLGQVSPPASVQREAPWGAWGPGGLSGFSSSSPPHPLQNKHGTLLHLCGALLSK